MITSITWYTTLTDVMKIYVTSLPSYSNFYSKELKKENYFSMRSKICSFVFNKIKYSKFIGAGTTLSSLEEISLFIENIWINDNSFMSI